MENDKIIIRGAKVHNLKNINVDIPLGKIVGIAGVSGSGKSSLALGVLYAEGSRRYLEALSTYTRRRISQSTRADVEEILHVPAAVALHQRPGVPGVRSTFGTGTELLNSLRLMFSRLASHRCPNCGHYHKPSLDVAAEKELICENCGTHFYGPGAEDLAFNSSGACEKCGGTGVVMTVDRSTLVPDETLTIDEGAVAPWNSLMWSLMTDVCRAMGVRTDVPFNQLTAEERNIVFNGPAVKKTILYKAKKSETAGERQRMQLARVVRNRTTGILYVLDEPSIGLHPANIKGLKGVMQDLIADGNSIVLVDHDTQIFRDADWLIKMGPGGGGDGGTVVAQGTPADVAANPCSLTGHFIKNCIND